MSKSLGQVAYEAWHLEHMSPGLSAPYNWNNEYPDGREAWQAAAEAVFEEVTHRDRPLDGIDNVLSAKPMFMRAVYEGALTHAESERLWAVIEAARARDTGLTLSCIEHADNCCYEWCDACQSGLKADSALLYAIEALDSEEG